MSKLLGAGLPAALPCGRITGGVFLAMVLAACATGPYRPFDARAAREIHTIVVLSVSDPENPSVNDFGGQTGYAGLVASQEVYGARFRRALELYGFEFGREMQEVLAQRLRRAGYSVLTAHARRKDPAKLISDYGKIPTAGADAWLDMAVGPDFGYSSVSRGQAGFRPHIQVDVRLVSTRNKRTLYAERILYGYSRPELQATELPAAARFFFEDANHLLSDKREIVEGLRAAIDAIAVHIAGRLGRPGN